MNQKNCGQDPGPVEKEWYVDAFGVFYPIIYAHRTVEAARREVDFAVQAVNLLADDCVLDLCCGAGRHLETLQCHTGRLVGVDYSPHLLALAHTESASTTQLIRADMRALPFHDTFDVLFSFFTSFGYFMEERDNERTAAAMARALKPTGRFFMDYLNPLNVADTLRPQSERMSRGYRIAETRWIDRTTRRINKRAELFLGDEKVGETMESVRLYECEELTALLEGAGLRVHALWGDYDGGDYGADSPRMILMGRRGAV